MATFEESFLYPLILLLVGAGITSLLIPWFTKRWEDRKKELEIKVDMASKMAEIIGTSISDSRILIQVGKEIDEASQVPYYQNVKKWLVPAKIIRSKLESYFSETDLIKRWDDYVLLLEAYNNASLHYLSDPSNKEYMNTLRTGLDIIEKQLSITLGMTIDHKQWTNVMVSIQRLGDEIIRDVLRLHIKII